VTRKAPAWVPDEVLERIGALIRDESFARDARRTPLVWPHGVERLLEHAGGAVPGNELHEPIDDLVGRYGLPRVALTLLRSGAPMTTVKPVTMRLLADESLEPVAEPEPFEPGTEGSEDLDGLRDELDRSQRERERLALELQRTREKLLEKDRKLRDERQAHQDTRSDLTSARDKALHQISALHDQIEAGPTGAVLVELNEGRDAAERLADVARVEATAARDEAEVARREVERLRAELEAAQAAVEAARSETAAVVSAAQRARGATPTPEDLLRAVRAVTAASLERLDRPAAGDAELLEAASAIARWAAARAAEPAAGGSHGPVTLPVPVPSPPTPPITTSELSVPGAASPQRIATVPAAVPAPPPSSSWPSRSCPASRSVRSQRGSPSSAAAASAHRPTSSSTVVGASCSTAASGRPVAALRSRPASTPSSCRTRTATTWARSPTCCARSRASGSTARRPRSCWPCTRPTPRRRTSPATASSCAIPARRTASSTAPSS
jgi:hypothetical protein